MPGPSAGDLPLERQAQKGANEHDAGEYRDAVESWRKRYGSDDVRGDLNFVRGLGADVVLDYANANENNLLDRADVVIDAVGGATSERAIRLVRPGGRLVTFSQPVDPATVAGRDLQTHFFIVEANAAELASIASLVDSGELRPTVARVYSLAEGRAAYEEGSQLHEPGKTVLRVR